MAQNRCKPRQWDGQAAARDWLIWYETVKPLDALGMEPYHCGTCGKWHVGHKHVRRT
jgi:hypothetical protein